MHRIRRLERPGHHFIADNRRRGPFQGKSTEAVLELVQIRRAFFRKASVDSKLLRYLFCRGLQKREAVRGVFAGEKKVLLAVGEVFPLAAREKGQEVEEVEGIRGESVEAA